MTDDRPTQPPADPAAPEPAAPGESDAPGADDLPPRAEDPFGSSPLYAFAVRHNLLRPTNGRVFAGVCGAFGRATNTDPVLWRVILAVLTIFGGAGLLVYLIGWLMLPSEGDTGSPVEAVLGRGRSGTPTVVTVIVALIVVLSLAAFLGGRAEPGFFIVLLLLGGGYLLLRERGTGQGPGVYRTGPGPAGAYQAGPGPAGPATPGYAPAAYPPFPGADMSSTTTTPLGPPPPGTPPRAPFAPHGPYAPPPPPPTWQQHVPVPPAPKPPRSRLGGLVFSAMLVVLGVIALIDLTRGSVPGSVYIAAALGTVGLGLVLGAWIGRARGLIALGIILSLLLAMSSASDHVRTHNWGHMGNITWTPETTGEIQSSYKQGAGDITLDLSKIDFTDHHVTTSVDSGAGNLTIILPDKVDATVTAKVFAGNADVLDESWDGISNPARTITDAGPDGPGGGTVTIDVDLTAGNLEVHR